jgi:hypothetical protein
MERRLDEQEYERNQHTFEHPFGGKTQSGFLVRENGELTPSKNPKAFAPWSLPSSSIG